MCPPDFIALSHGITVGVEAVGLPGLATSLTVTQLVPPARVRNPRGHAKPGRDLLPGKTIQLPVWLWVQPHLYLDRDYEVAPFWSQAAHLSTCVLQQARQYAWSDSATWSSFNGFLYYFRSVFQRTGPFPLRRSR